MIIFVCFGIQNGYAKVRERTYNFNETVKKHSIRRKIFRLARKYGEFLRWRWWPLSVSFYYIIFKILCAMLNVWKNLHALIFEHSSHMNGVETNFQIFNWASKVIQTLKRKKSI